MKRKWSDEYCVEILFKIYAASITGSPPEVFLGEGALKICSKSIGEHLCRSLILIHLQSNFIKITLQHGCSPVNLLHIFRSPFPKNTSAGLLMFNLESQKQLKTCVNSSTVIDILKYKCAFQARIISRESINFPLRISLVNVTKSGRNCRSGHIYCGNF